MLPTFLVSVWNPGWFASQSFSFLKSPGREKWLLGKRKQKPVPMFFVCSFCPIVVIFSPLFCKLWQWVDVKIRNFLQLQVEKLRWKFKIRFYGNEEAPLAGSIFSHTWSDPQCPPALNLAPYASCLYPPIISSALRSSLQWQIDKIGFSLYLYFLCISAKNNWNKLGPRAFMQTLREIKFLSQFHGKGKWKRNLLSIWVCRSLTSTWSWATFISLKPCVAARFFKSLTGRPTWKQRKFEVSFLAVEQWTCPSASFLSCIVWGVSVHMLVSKWPFGSWWHPCGKSLFFYHNNLDHQ